MKQLIKTEGDIKVYREDAEDRTCISAECGPLYRQFTFDPRTAPKKEIEERVSVIIPMLIKNIKLDQVSL